MNFGIDKLTLTTKDFSVANLNGYSTKGDKIGEQSPFLLTTKEGEDVFANQALKKEPIGNSGEGLIVSFNRNGMQLQINPSKYKHPYHLEGIGNLSNVKEDVQAILNNLGIDCALESLKISRLDVTKQLESQRKYPGWKGAFDLIANTSKRSKENLRYYTSDTFRTSQYVQHQFYDKGIELKSGKQKLNIPERNLIRCETRVMDTKACQKYLGVKRGINYFSDLLKWNNEELNDFQNEVLTNELFNKTKVYQLETTMDLEKLVQQVKNVGGFANFFKGRGIVGSVEDIGIETLMIAVQIYNPKITRQGLNNFKRNLIDNYQKINLALNNTEVTKQELLYDLRKEFIDNFRVA
jgi:hypothetical protein